MIDLKGKKVTDEEVLQELAARCRQDQVFRKALRNDPEAVLNDLGVIVPQGMTVQVAGDTPETECLILGEGLTDEDLEKVAGGATTLNVGGLVNMIRPVMPLYGVA